VVQVVVDVVVEVVVESSVDASLYVGVDIIADIVVGIGTKVGVDVGVAIVIRYLNEFQDMVQVLFPVTVKSFFFMVYICHGYNRKRLVLDCSRFYSREELFRISRDQHKGQHLSLEYTSGLYQPLSCDRQRTHTTKQMFEINDHFRRYLKVTSEVFTHPQTPTTKPTFEC
jgi:hypothetical protein